MTDGDSTAIKKPKIMRVVRIRVKVGGVVTTIYVSNAVSARVRDWCVRLDNNVFCPQKGRNQLVVEMLRTLVRDLPDHFSGAARMVLA